MRELKRDADYLEAAKAQEKDQKDAVVSVLAILLLPTISCCCMHLACNVLSRLVVRLSTTAGWSRDTTFCVPSLLLQRKKSLRANLTWLEQEQATWNQQVGSKSTRKLITGGGSSGKRKPSVGRGI